MFSRETRLVAHVKANAPHVNENPPQVENVLTAIDSLPCKDSLSILNKEKGSLLDDAVKKFDPRVALELGFSGGCSAIRIASKMTKSDSKLLTLQPNNARTQIAKELIEHAGLSRKVEVETSRLPYKEHAKLKEFLRNMEALHFDFVFIRHYTRYFLPDFLFLRDQGMLSKGTVIVANTMGYTGFQNYLKYLKDHPEELETETYRSESGSTTMTVSTYIAD